MKVMYPGDRLKLVFTDTDSLRYTVKTCDVYQDMDVDALEKYDFSGYPFNHPLYSEKNKKIIEMMTDELDSIPLNVEKATGTKRNVKDSELTFNFYLKTLMTKKNHM